MVGAENTPAHVEEALIQLDIIALLQVDERPTLILDLEKSNPDVLRPGFCNRSFRNSSDLVVLISDRVIFKDSYDQREHINFVRRATDGNGVDAGAPSYTYKSLCWTRCTLRQRWRVISGTFVLSSTFDELHSCRAGYNG